MGKLLPTLNFGRGDVVIFGADTARAALAWSSGTDKSIHLRMDAVAFLSVVVLTPAWVSGRGDGGCEGAHMRRKEGTHCFLGSVCVPTGLVAARFGSWVA